MAGFWDDGGAGMIRTVTAAVVRFVLLLAVWWILTEGDTRYWYYGLAAGALATALSLRVAPPAPARRGRRPWEVPALAGWFLWSAVRGGVDVARRAITPRMPISPHTIRVPATTVPGSVGRRVGLWMVNLMPGSLSVDEGDDWVELHVLSSDLDPGASWAELDRRLSRISGT